MSDNWIPLPSDGESSAKPSVETKSAKEMLQKALADHGSKPANDTNLSQPQNIVDVLFKDFISRKISQETSTVNAVVDQKSASSQSISDLLDIEIKSIRSSSHSSNKHSDKKKKSNPNNEKSVTASDIKVQSISKTPLEKNGDGLKSGTQPENLNQSGNYEQDSSVSPKTAASGQEVPTAAEKNDKVTETSLSMLPLPLAKKVVKPKLFDIKLSKESVSLLKEIDRKATDEGEEGEVFSSNSGGESDKNNSSDSDDGALPSEESQDEGKKSRSSKHKKKHKHKKKKKKKKSKSKDKSRDEKKSSSSHGNNSDVSGKEIVRVVYNELAAEKCLDEGNEDRKRKSDKLEMNEGGRLDVPDKKLKTDSQDDINDGKKKDQKKRRKSRSKSKSRSRSPKKGKRSSRSRSKSPRRSKHSRSRSPRRTKRSKSRSPKRSKRSRSKSPKRSRRSRSKSPRRSKRSKSKSPRRSRRSRSKSPHKSKHSRSRSKSPRKDKYGSSSSKSSRDKSSERRRNKETTDSSDLRVKIDKAKLRKIAIANALNNMKTGQGPEVSINTRAGGKSVEELTDFCKKISEKEKHDSDPSESEEEMEEENEEESLIHHPFKLRENSTNIVLNIRNAKQLPVLNPAEKQAQQATLRLTFPVSSGSHHRATESEWVPVEPKQPAASLETFPAAPKKEKAEKTKSIFPTAEETKNIDIGSIISERLQAVRKLQENPYDMQALSKMHHAQENAKKWASSKQLPGQFSGSTGAQVMSQQEIIGDRRHQAWAKKTQLSQAAPVNGGIGMALLQKMGWKQGEGLGKNNEGSKLPLMLDIKVDRKGLKSNMEGKKGGNLPVPKPAARAKDLSNKHPVSALMELCNRRRWGAPLFTVVSESGPDHQKNFLFKVKVNNVEYQPAMASGNKKLAKAQCAAVCLQEMGLLPRDAPLNI